MIKNLVIGLLLAFSITAARADTPDSIWHLVNSVNVPAGPAMTWTSNDTGFFLGSTLNITATTDSGASFTVFNFPDSIVTINGAHSRYLTFEQITGGMSWPTSATGYIAGVTTSDTFGHSARPTILKTTNAGTTWSQYYPSDTLLSFSNMDFPRARVGYASATLNDSSVVLKTNDGGVTWSVVAHSDTLSFQKLHFFDANNGIVFAQASSNHLWFTTDGGTSFHAVALADGSLLTFLDWNVDSSWLVAIDSSMFRSIDSGKHWTHVVSADAGGDIQTVAIHDSIGYAFRSDAPIVLTTKNYGVTWKSDTLPRVAGDSLQAQSASMPSSTEAYLLATDPSNNNTVLLKIVIPPPSQNQGGVAMAPGEISQLSATMQGNAILFTTNSADRAQTIDVMDIMGRVCVTLALPPGTTTSVLPISLLRPGSYFARLGGTVVKFATWN